MYSYVTAGASTGFSGEIAGLNPARSRLVIPPWCHRIAPKATSKLKAQAEAKLHMYCFVL
jgi:hypothetical protein